MMMKKRILFWLIIFGVQTLLFAQGSEIELSLTTKYQGGWIPYDSIKITNLNQNCDTVLVYPDTLLVLDYVTGISQPDIGLGYQLLSQNHPNPCVGETNFEIHLSKPEKVFIDVRDLTGKLVLEKTFTLNTGFSKFKFYPGKQAVYLLTASTSGIRESIKILCTVPSAENHKPKISFIQSSDGFKFNQPGFRNENFTFTPGDELQFVCFAKTPESIQGSEVIRAVITASEDFHFNITEGLPCLSIPMMVFEGEEYKTVAIGEQCWFKRNLNRGTFLIGIYDMSDDGVVEKYCYNNLEINCKDYGGLYQWDELMNYSTTPGCKGICPEGWHIPTDEDFKILEGAADSYFGYPHAEWDMTDWRGTDVGFHLKSTSGWFSNGNGDNLVGFSALPAGFRSTNGSFDLAGEYCYFWFSSTMPDNDAWSRFINLSHQDIYRWDYDRDIGFPVRCVMDNP
jgi:uncharacterized protein (TIGR02145 family)